MIHPFLHKHGEPSYLHLSEFKNFQGNILHLGYVVDGHTGISFKDFFNQVKKTVEKHNIDIILLDCTGEPWDLDFKYLDNYSPKKLQTAFSKICKTVIVSEDWTYYYKPQPNIIFFPYNLWIQSTQKIDQYYSHNINTDFRCDLEKTKPLMCLNRNTHWHRLYILIKMTKAFWLPKVDFSFVLPVANRLYHPKVEQKLTRKEINYISRLALPIYLDYEQQEIINYCYSNGASSVNVPVYNRCAINLITETSVDDPNLVTEKTTKAFSAYQIPILIGKPGINQYLEDLGLDMFSDYVPWKTWDQEPNPKLRMKKIFKFVNHIMFDTQSILDTHKKFYPRLVRNKEYFHSKDFEGIITEQLHVPINY